MAEVLKKFGRYFLLDHIAQGGMAEIFRARLASIDGAGRLLVIKRIQAGYGGNIEFLQMFRSEIKVTMGFNHPNIAQLYDFGEEMGQPYIAMEFIDGRNVRQFLSKLNQQSKTFPVEFAAHIIEQAACGLQYAHSFRDKISGQPLHIVHRDISPQNILLSYDGNTKVIDFGIAKATTNLESTRAGVIKGKPSYLSPEQITGDVLDGRCDIFALGIVLWELLVGKKLFAGENDLAVLKQIESCQNVKPPSALNPNVPKELDYIVLRALARNADKRFQSAEEFQRALHKFLISFSPEFSPQDIAQFAKELFQEEIIEDRKHIRRLNDRVEQLLIATGSVSSPAISAGGDATVDPDDDTTTVVKGLTRAEPAPVAAPVEKVIDAGDLKKERVELDYKSTRGVDRTSVHLAPATLGTRSTGSRPRPVAAVTGSMDYYHPGSAASAASDDSHRGSAGGKFKLLVFLAAMAAGVYFGPEVVREWMHPKEPKVAAPVAVAPRPPGEERKPASTISLKLNLNPSGEGTRVTVNGGLVDSGTGTIEVTMDEPLELEVQRAGYLPFHRDFMIASKDARGQRAWPIDITLEPTRFGQLSIHTTPSAEATILIEGKFWVRKTPFEGEKLPAGEYKVKLTNELLGMEKTIRVTVKEGIVTNIPDERLEIKN